jgi:hypothetical protein
MRLILITLAVFLNCLPVFADDDGSVRRHLALELVQRTSSDPAKQVVDAIWPPYEEQLRALNPRVKEETLTGVKAVLADGLSMLAHDLNEKKAEIYARELSADDLRAVLDFFDSEVGLNYMRANSRLDAEAGGLLTDYMRSTIPKIIEELNDYARRAGLKVNA